MIDRLEYLVRTLSRTKRKDHENYVLGAIWNRLSPEARSDLKPVSQQPVRSHANKLYYIDLFFPQLGIAVECDERFHESQREADSAREQEIINRLSPVAQPDLFTSMRSVSIDACEFLRIPIPWMPHKGTLRGTEVGSEDVVPAREVTLEMLDDSVEQAVSRIHERWNELRDSPTFLTWSQLEETEDPTAFYAHRDAFAISDGVTFRTVTELCNILLGDSYKGLQMGYFTTRGMLANGYTRRYKIWSPKLVAATNETFAWQNTLSADGQTILTHRGDGTPVSEITEHEVTTNLTFAQGRDPVTRHVGYRFVGVFERVPGPAGVTENASAEVYRRVAVEFPKLPPHTG